MSQSFPEWGACPWFLPTFALRLRRVGCPEASRNGVSVPGSIWFHSTLTHFGLEIGKVSLSFPTGNWRLGTGHSRPAAAADGRGDAARASARQGHVGCPRFSVLDDDLSGWRSAGRSDEVDSRLEIVHVVDAWLEHGGAASCRIQQQGYSLTVQP